MATAPPTRRLETAGEKRGDATVIFEVDGVDFPVWVKEVSAADAGARRLYPDGYTIAKAIADFTTGGSLDLDTVATFVWLSRRQNGEPLLRYGDVVDTITYATEFTFRLADPDLIAKVEQDDSPEV
jgi:hypothetical protein